MHCGMAEMPHKLIASCRVSARPLSGLILIGFLPG
jgi:hypothetical protein